MEIVFDNAWGIYYAGTEVAGRLHLNLSAPQKVTELIVKIRGEANVEWSERITKKDGDETTSETVKHTSNELYFDNRLNLMRETQMLPGSYAFDFRAILPPNLPSSFEGDIGHIRYTVTAVLNCPWNFNKECKAAFTVVCPVDLNQESKARAPIRTNKSSTVGMWCCYQGELSATLSSPFTGYTPGQNIPVNLDVENMTKRNVTNTCCELQRSVDCLVHNLLSDYICKRCIRPAIYQTRDHVVWDCPDLDIPLQTDAPSAVTFGRGRLTYKTPTAQKTQEMTIGSMTMGTVGAHGENSWTENILVPSIPATSKFNCSIIKIAYRLSVEIHVSGACYRGLFFSVPLTIGTIPLISTSDRRQQDTLDPNRFAMGFHPSGLDGGNYSDLPPPSYEACMFGRTENDNTDFATNWAPKYPSYKYTPTAPPPLC